MSSSTLKAHLSSRERLVHTSRPIITLTNPVTGALENVAGPGGPTLNLGKGRAAKRAAERAMSRRRKAANDHMRLDGGLGW